MPSLDTLILYLTLGLVGSGSAWVVLYGIAVIASIKRCQRRSDDV